MKIVVIRGGFIQTHVVNRLRHLGHDVTVLSKDQTHRLACDVAIHMYAMTVQDAVAFVRDFGDLASRLIVISSGDVYRAYGRLLKMEDCEYESGPLTEDSPLRTALHPYPSHPKYDKIPVECEV